MTTLQNNHKVIVIGHRNPDTDSICSAIAYAALKNKLAGSEQYEACRAGEPNRETIYALKRFHMAQPRRCLNVKPQVQDIQIRQVPGIPGDTTMRHAWEIMRDEQANTQAIVDENGRLQGLITLKDMAMANMDSLDTGALATAKTPMANVVKTIEGTVLAGNPDQIITKGKIVIGAGSPETMESSVDPGDIVIVANRYESQLCAIELEAACVVVCTGSPVARTIIKQANEHNCVIISTTYDTYAAAALIRQSVPVCANMTPSDKLLGFNPSTSIDVVRQVMGDTRHVYFPVVDRQNNYIGLISRRNLLNLQRKQLILVDHNEKTQCVDGFEEADILEIIDHHRVGSLETGGPVFFYNRPVGCTATIVLQMYRENGLQPEPNIAGLMLCALLSDTLGLRSPTCTDVDRAAARDLSEIAGVDINELADSMFTAGEDINGRTAEEVFFQDFKLFTHGDARFGVGQASFMSMSNLEAAEALLAPYMPEALQREKVDLIMFMFTDVKTQSSTLYAYGPNAASQLNAAFGGGAAAGENGVVTIQLNGVVSRKKQLIPALLSTIS